ncbi:MAG: hypothetical protein PHR16_10800 [Methylovulum sp.]|nr:hypothetical protein [Methylovulum sp.]
MKKAKLNIPFSTLALAISLIFSGTVQAEWINSYGTKSSEFGSVTPSSQGGYYLSMLSSPLAQTSKPTTLFSLLNANGNPLWTKKITSGAYDSFFLSELSNGRVLLQGSTSATATGNNDAVWALYNVNRTTGALSPVFRRIYKGKGNDLLSITQDKQGGLWGTGSTTSFSQDGKGTDMLLAKLNVNNGAPIWSKAYHYDYNDSLAAFIPKGNNFILLANAKNSGGGSQKIVLGQLNSLGDPVVGSFKKYGGTGLNTAINIKPISQGNYLVYGTNQVSIKNSNTTVFVIKLNSNLGYIWGKKYVGNPDQGLGISDINENANGSFTLTGNLRTPVYFSGFPLYTAQHPTIMQLSSTGTVSAANSFEYQEIDSGNFSRNADGSYRLDGQTMAFNLSGSGVGDIDALYGLFSANITPDWIKTLGGPKVDIAFISPQAGGYGLSGSTSSWGAGNLDVLAGKLDANGDVPGCPYIKEVSMVKTTPKINVSNLNWQPQAAALVKKGAIQATSVALKVSNAAITVKSVCKH